MDYKQIKAIEIAYIEKLRKLVPNIKHCMGIYILTREDEIGIKYAYIGQSVDVLTRLVQHMMGFQYIDISIKKHGLYDEEKNPYGWNIENIIECQSNLLNQIEKEMVIKYSCTHQLRNKTGGGQDSGKVAIETKSTKTYQEGIQRGKEIEKKYITNLFVKYLDVAIKGNTNKIKERMYKQFMEYIGEEIWQKEDV